MAKTAAMVWGLAGLIKERNAGRVQGPDFTKVGLLAGKEPPKQTETGIYSFLSAEKTALNRKE